MVLVDTERRVGLQDGLPNRNAADVVPPEAKALDEIVAAVEPFAGQELADTSLIGIVDKAVDFPRLRQLGADLAYSGKESMRTDGWVRTSRMLPSNRGICFMIGASAEDRARKGVYLSYERNGLDATEEVRITDENVGRTIKVVRSRNECQVYLSERLRGQAARRTGTVFIRGR